jgi:indole-3-glycerol phosphate synthase
MIKECEKLGADIISIHTNEFWGGSWNWLKEARSITKTPILAKGFHPTQSDINMAISCGADFVLTVGWWNGDHNCFHECESLLELSESKARTTVWNSRDPRTGQKRYYTEQAVLTHRNPHNKFLIQASGIEVGDEIPDGVNAILIGQGLWKQYE